MKDHGTPTHDFASVTDFNNLYQSFTEARKGKRWKYSVCKYEANVLENLLFIQVMLQRHKYRLSPYNCFYVHEPKERLIMYNSFRDKIVQHCLCEQVLEPVLSKTFIYDNYASQKGKGTHFGLDRLKSFMSAYYRKNGVEGWVLKCDVRKYFYRINHDVLKSQLRRLIKDRDVLWLLDMIVDSTEGPGIPIGNHTSQWFAILYLSDMDHMIKERLGIKYYGRYMDDFYLIHEDRAYLQFCLEEIRRFLVPMGLELNQKTAIFPLSQGIDFLGFRTYLTDSGKAVRKVRRESKNRIRRKIKKFRHLVDEGRVDFDTVLQSYNSWTGHADHGNSYHLISEIDDLFFNLFREEMEGKPYGEISIRFARWKRRQVGEHSCDVAESVKKYNGTNKGPQLKIGDDHELAAYIERRIVEDGYSPAAVLGEIRVKGLKFKTSICKSTLYSYIRKGVFLTLEMRDLPRHGKNKRGYTRTHKKGARASAGTSIEERPEEVNARATIGHWEMDSVLGKKRTKPALLVLSERYSRKEIIIKVKDHTAASVVRALDRLERKMGSPAFRSIFRSITVDNGSEFADAAGMEQSCRSQGPRTKVYYCHPYSSWERGTNENTNGLIRRWFPKGTDFTKVTTQEIQKVEDWLNAYPREILGFLSADAVFSAGLASLV